MRFFVIGSAQLRVVLNYSRIDMLTTKIPTNVEMVGLTRNGVIVAGIDGASLVTVKDHRMVQIQVEFLKDMFDEKNFIQTH